MSFRSEPLKLCQMVVEKDAAFHCVVELGQQGVAQFIDLNTNMSVFQRTFVREVRRCTELERSIRYIESEIVDAHATKHIPPLDISNTDVPQQRNIYDLEAKIHDLERDIRQLLTSEAQLKRNYNDLREFQWYTANTIARSTRNSMVYNFLQNSSIRSFRFIAGVVDAHKRHSFERVLWRACRRTAFVRTAEINDQFEDPDTGKLVLKAVFIIFFNGRKLQDIVNRVCDGFNAKLYTCPKSSKDRKLIVADVMIRLHDLSVVIDTTERHKLEEKSGSTISPIINIMETSQTPPTFNRTNNFTRVFQDIVDSYGIATYQEINPGKTTECFNVYISGPYLIGVDPIWNIANNRLNFLNSMKMKASVIIGIAQMILGVMLSFINAGISLCTVVAYWTYQHVDMVEKFLSVRVRMGSIEEAELITEENGESRPLNWKEARKSESHPRPDHDPTEFGDLMVHQCIHTIEFVLGCISHTASYLRLWALSLAHARMLSLKTLFIDIFRIIRSSFSHGLGTGFQEPRSDMGSANVVHLFCHVFNAYGFRSSCYGRTISVSTRASIALFQSKFYEGAGHSFMPLHFKTSLRKLCAESAYL
ncbi:V-type proton ATPase subunit a [Aphelenchoides besseyi]|nr:V-type proton ATPase subunit a [Aphelenchoides besseyi]